MYYRLDIYLDGIWQEWSASGDKNRIRENWQYLIDNRHTCRVSEVRDITSGLTWID